MSVTRSQLGRGPGIVTFNGGTFFTREDILAKHGPVWEPVKSTLHGQHDKFKKDWVVKLPLTLYGLWQNLSILFPSYALNPSVSTPIFGATDIPLIILGKNGDKITYTNAGITKLADLYLGVDSELFAAAVEVTCLLGNGKNPEDASAYFVRDTGQAYSETTYANTNFKKTRFTGAWGSVSGFTSVAAQKGWHVAWNLDVKYDGMADLGTVGAYIGDGCLVAAAKCIPVGPTQAQIDTAQAIGGGTTASPAAGTAHGVLLSAGGADLTIAGTGISIVLKQAAMVESSTAFGIDPLRVGEIAWETTRLFTTGTPNAVATIS